jgi:hypothetical protein
MADLSREEIKDLADEHELSGNAFDMDDEPQAVGHCVVETPVTLKGQLTLMINVQGLTAHDFHCDSYIPDTAEKTDE